MKSAKQSLEYHKPLIPFQPITRHLPSSLSLLWPPIMNILISIPLIIFTNGQLVCPLGPTLVYSFYKLKFLKGITVFDKQNIYIVILQTVPAFYMQIHTHVKLLNEVIVYKNFTEYMHESNRVIRLIVMHLSQT